MIDIHCHILPSIDDGAVDMDTAVRMAHQAVDEGIHTIIATPHHNNCKYMTPTASRSGPTDDTASNHAWSGSASYLANA